MSDSTLSTVNLAPPDGYWCSLDGNILTVATSDLGNADTSYTYVPLALYGFNIFSLQLVITATTITIEATNDAGSVADASAVWLDITNVCTDGASSSVTATGSINVMNPLPWSRLRIKRVTTNATNALKLKLTRMRVR